MSDQDQMLEQVRIASQRLALADMERVAALDEATAALQELDEVPTEEVAEYVGVSPLAIDALRSRRRRWGTAKDGTRTKRG